MVRKRPMKKITKSMLTRAENKHFRTETRSSLEKHYALIYIRARQTKNTKLARYMARIPGVKSNARKMGYIFKWKNWEGG